MEENHQQNDDGTWSEAEPCEASWEKSESDKIKKSMVTKLLMFGMFTDAMGGYTNESEEDKK